MSNTSSRSVPFHRWLASCVFTPFFPLLQFLFCLCLMVMCVVSSRSGASSVFLCLLAVFQPGVASTRALHLPRCQSSSRPIGSILPLLTSTPPPVPRPLVGLLWLFSVRSSALFACSWGSVCLFFFFLHRSSAFDAICLLFLALGRSSSLFVTLCGRLQEAVIPFLNDKKYPASFSLDVFQSTEK